MPLWREFLSRCCSFIIQGTTPILAPALLLFLLFGLIAHSSQDGYASTGQQVTVTFSGTVTGTDTDGWFLNAGDGFAGMSFTAVYTFNDGGGTTYLGTRTVYLCDYLGNPASAARSSTC